MTKQQEDLAAQGYFAISAVAKRLGKPRQSILYWIGEEKVKAVKVGSYWFVNWPSVVDYYRENDPNSVDVLHLNDPPVVAAHDTASDEPSA